MATTANGKAAKPSVSDDDRLRALWELLARRAKDPAACVLLMALHLEGGHARSTHLRETYGLSQYVLDTVGRQLRYGGEITYDGNEMRLLEQKPKG